MKLKALFGLFLFMPNPNNILKIIQALSLDVVLGGVVFSYAIGHLFWVSLPWPVLVALAICIWLIYTFDHLIDTSDASQSQLTYRHRFHFEHRKLLIRVAIFMILVGVGILFLLPGPIIFAGTVVSACIVIYFILVRWTSFWNKELLVAIGYTAGIFLAPLVMSERDIGLYQVILLVQTLLLAYSNLLIFSYADQNVDSKAGYPSTILKLGLKKAGILITALFCINSMVISLGLMVFDLTEFIIVQCIFLCMHFILGWLFVRLVTRNEADHFLRWVGDGVFLLPGLIFLFRNGL